jgi:predicted lipoprotein with Yx(FWY)xxD motif
VSTIFTGRRAVLASCAAATVLAISGCGSDEPASPASPQVDNVVATKDLPEVGTVLVDTSGKTLYFTDTDQAGDIRCTGECLELWHPAAAPGGGAPAGPVTDLGVVKRPDGTDQLTHQNRPLYTFTLDSPDKPTSGHNVTDSFGGVEFTWHAVVVEGSGQQPPPPSGGDDGYGGGGGY